MVAFYYVVSTNALLNKLNDTRIAMLTFALTLFGIVLIGFPLALLVIAVKERREVKTATLKLPRRPTRVNVSNDLITAEEAA